MKIYTKTGDGGETGLLGGKRTFKDALRIEALGQVDELNAQLGWCRVVMPKRVDAMLREIQHKLFTLGASLARSEEQSDFTSSIAQLEHWIDELDNELEPLQQFILPGGSEAAARLHVSRAVCRRAERAVVRLVRKERGTDVSVGLGDAVKYLNRLSDFLFVAARWANNAEGVQEEPWNN